MRVQRGYVKSGQTVERALAATNGLVFQGNEWTRPAGEVVKVPGVFERWCDVPQAWLGFAPWWK